MRGRLRVLGGVALVAACWGAASRGADGPLYEFPLFVGDATCRGCHEAGRARPCVVEEIPGHRAAHAALGRSEAQHIAALSGVAGPPASSRLCLRCHATGADEGPRWMAAGFEIERGVQCEACHGAGSFHVEARRSSADDRAQRRPFDVARPDREALCATCHFRRDSHDDVRVRGYRRPAADRLYKTPVNLALDPAGRRLYVVCTNDDTLVVVDVEQRAAVGEIRVGRRPFDVAVAEDGRTLYVTNRLDGTVTVIDAARREPVGTIEVGADPHGAFVAGRRLYVMNSGEDTVSVVDLDRGTEEVRLPAGDGPWGVAGGVGSVLRFTNVRPQPAPFRGPVHSEIGELSLERGTIVRRLAVPDANMLQGIDFVPGTSVALFTFLRTKHLVPSTQLSQGWSICNGLGVAWPDGRVDQVLLDDAHDHFPDPTDVAVAPDGRYALVAGGGIDQVVVVDVEALLALLRGATDRERRDVLPNRLGTAAAFVARRVAVGANPRAVLFAPDGRLAFVANALDDSVELLAVPGFEPVARVPLGGPREITETRRGERLFYSARNAYANQFSCNSCHPDGHVNGLTFDIEPDGAGKSPVDNRTLRGILDTAPFKWEGTNPDLSRQCGARLAVFFTRLAPFEPDELRALVRYMATIESPPNPQRDPRGLTPEQRHGKTVFERLATRDGRRLRFEERCDTCHATAYGTNRQSFDVGSTMWFDAPASYEPVDLEETNEFGPYGILYFINAPGSGRAFDTPHLRNLHESAPYMHNGSAPTLEEVWTRFNVYETHGVTIDLTRREFNDLIAYLKSL